MKKNQQKIKQDIPWNLIRSKVRQIWLWSWQRKEAVKRSNGKCERCGGPYEKKNVHHIKGIFSLEENPGLYLHDLFCPSKFLLTLCHKCHVLIHREEKACLLKVKNKKS